MSRIVFLLGFVFFSSLASAQSYFGAVLSFTRIGFDCPSGAECDHSGRGLKVYGGAKLPDKMTLDAGFVRVDSIEVSYLGFKEVRSRTAPQQVGYLDENGDVQFREADAGLKVQADALVAALVARAPVVNQLEAVFRLGGAYVSSTYRTDLDGKSKTSETVSKLKPYFGVGIEYEVPSLMKLVGSFDMTKYDVAGKTGNLRMIGVGAQTSF